MSLSEILDEIPKLSFAERQEVVRRAMEMEDRLSPEEDALLDARMSEFSRSPETGIGLEELREQIKMRLERR